MSFYFKTIAFYLKHFFFCNLLCVWKQNCIWLVALHLTLQCYFVLKGWSWWSKCSGSTNDLEDCCGRYTIWWSKGWNWMQPKRIKQQWAGTSNSRFHSEDTRPHWNPYWHTSPGHGNKCPGLIIFNDSFLYVFIISSCS